MSPDRWRQIEALYLAALDRTGAERDALLSAADPDVAREVNSMLTKGAKDVSAPSSVWRVPEMIGVYRVEGRIGEGGMGVVYRAFDTRLNRPVAIKFLSDSLDADARRRFQREAQTASSLNHPHIVTVYDIGEIQDRQYLVTEYVEEGTLRAWVKSPRGWRQVVEMIIGVADALATTHGANILHRDIKPENVLFTKSGYAKLTDFGLAKVYEGDPSNMATGSVDASATQAGVIMGTIAYMSPEQASGKPLDSRSDIFSFGVMLYELLSGTPPFTGATGLETLQRVVHAAPVPLGENIPIALRGIVEKALEKDPADRYQTMRELVVDLRRVARSGDSAVAQVLGATGSQTPIQASVSGMPLAAPRKTKWLVPVIAIVATAAVFALWMFRSPRSAPVIGDAVRLQVSLPPNTGFSVSGAFAVSPDGKKLVFSALGADNIARLWLRNLDATGATVLDGTGHDPRGSMVFWSPDSRKIAFAGARATFVTMDVSDGKPREISNVTVPRGVGGAWGQGMILLGNQPGIVRVDEATGQVTALTAVDATSEVGHSYPVLLPDGNHFLYVRAFRERGKTAVYAGSVDAKPEQQDLTPIILSGSVPQVAENAGVTQLLFYRGGMIYAQNFDGAKLRLSGNPVPVVDQVDSGSDGQARFSVSRTGVLVYRVGGTDIDRQFTMFDRQGKMLRTVGEPHYYWNFKISPDESRIVYERREENSADSIWVLDLQHGGTTRISPEGARNAQPVISPDGRRVAWPRLAPRERGGFDVMGVFQRPTDASGPEEILIRKENVADPQLTQWTPDGKYVLSFRGDGRTSRVFAMPVDGGPPIVAADNGFLDNGGYVSPNNRWIVYRSNMSGRNEMWVQAFPPATKNPKDAQKWMVSKDGALGGPRWRKDGRELVFIGADGYLTAVPVTTEGAFTSGAPEHLFQLPKDFLALSPVPGQFFDATPDNQKFMMLTPANRTPLDEFTVILNWPNAMKKKY